MMPKGGDQGGRKPRSPAASIARARGFAATRPEQLAGWTMNELRQVGQALRLAAAVFEDEQARRFEAAEEFNGSVLSAAPDYPEEG